MGVFQCRPRVAHDGAPLVDRLAHLEHAHASMAERHKELGVAHEQIEAKHAAHERLHEEHRASHATTADRFASVEEALQETVSSVTRP